MPIETLGQGSQAGALAPRTPGAPQMGQPGATDEAQLQEVMKRLLSRAAQPRSALQAQPQQQPKMIDTNTGVAKSHSEAGQMFVHNLFGLIFNSVQAQKQQQLKHATGVLSNLNNSWQKAQDLSNGDQKKAMEIFSQMPEVTHIMEDKKNVKQLGKLLQFDFMEPEKKKTVWHEALGKVVEAGRALGLTQAIQKMMKGHQDSQANQQPYDPAKKEQEASAAAKQLAGQARLQQGGQGQLTPAQELKTVMDGMKQQHQEMKDERAALDREKAQALREKQFDERKLEFDAREKDIAAREARIKQKQDDLNKYRGEVIQIQRGRLAQAGANTDLRRIVVGSNYDWKLLKPEEIEALGMQMDEDGNPVPLKSPLSATAMTKNAKQQAGVMDNLITTTMNVLDSPGLAEKLGPFQGRLSEIMQGKVGQNVPEFDTLRTLGSFDASGMLKLHFGARGGQQQYEKFRSLLDTGKMDLASLRESLNAFKTIAGAYEGEIKTVRDKGAKTTKKADEPKGGGRTIDLDH